MLVSVCLAVVFCIVAIDQVSKIIYWNVSRPLIGDIVWLTSTLNDGAAFSSFRGGRIYFIIFTIIALFILSYILITRKISNSFYFRLTLSILIGGIIGNFIDRYIFGTVRDFIYLVPLGFVCNIADIAICIATLMLIIFILFIHDFESHTKLKKRKTIGK